MKLLAETLEENQKLTHFSVNEDAISAKGSEALVAVLEKNVLRDIE